MKKRRVPAALHSELTEYASLLRALRTRDAMDLTAHLTKPSPFTLPPRSEPVADLDNDNLDDELLDELSSRSASAVNSANIAGPSDLDHSINKAIEEERAKTSGKKVAPPKRKRDQWTRWPLLLDDVPIPEWTLEDEVAVIASRVLKSRPTPTFPVFEGPLERDDPSHTDYVKSTEFEEDDPDHPFYVPYLTSITASLLSTIFSLLVKHTPARPASMQNRIEPLNWRSVIDVLVNCDSEYANPKVVENVIRRMEAIYGPSFSPLDGKMATSYRTVDRIKNKKAATDRIHKLFEEPMTSLFSQASPPPLTSPLLSTPPPSPPPKRKRDQIFSPGERNYKVRKRWVPKNDQEEHETEYNSENQHSKVSPEPVRRSTRARSKVNYNVDDTME